MAQHKLSGKQFLLLIDPAGGTTYNTVICLTSQSIKFGVNVIDASSNCGPDTLPGKPQPEAITFEGQHMYDPTSATDISGQDILPLLQASTKVGWSIAPEDPVTGDETLSGTGFFSELTKHYPGDGVVTFSGTLSIYGQSTQTITS